jgi:type IV pilus assembly protein PilM
MAAAPPPDAGAMTIPGGMTGDPNMVEMGPQTDLSGVTIQGPTGPGWVIEMYGHHFYNDRQKGGSIHVRNTLLKQLKEGVVDVPLGPGQPMGRFKMSELGIGYAILAHSTRPRQVWIGNPNFQPPTGPNAGAAGLGAAGLGTAPAPGILGLGGGDSNVVRQMDPNNPEAFQVNRYDFAVQFVWQEKPLNVRLEERRQAEIKAKEAAEAAAAAAAAGGSAPDAGPAPAPGSPGAPPPAPGAALPAGPPGAPGTAPEAPPAAAPSPQPPEAGVPPAAAPPQAPASGPPVGPPAGAVPAPPVPAGIPDVP